MWQLAYPGAEAETPSLRNANSFMLLQVSKRNVSRQSYYFRSLRAVTNPMLREQTSTYSRRVRLMPQGVQPFTGIS